MEIGKNNIGENEYFMTSNNVKHSLATTDKQTDLGVIIDSKLSFDDHINQVVNKATKMKKNNPKNLPIPRHTHFLAII